MAAASKSVGVSRYSFVFSVATGRDVDGDPRAAACRDVGEDLCTAARFVSCGKMIEGNCMISL